MTKINAKSEAKRKVTLQELGLETEPGCMNCGGKVDFVSIGNCVASGPDRKGSKHGWKKYCGLQCKYAHCHTASSEGDQKKHEAFSTYAVIQKPDGTNILILNMRGAAKKFGFVATNMIQQEYSKGFRLIKNNFDEDQYGELEFVDCSKE